LAAFPNPTGYNGSNKEVTLSSNEFLFVQPREYWCQHLIDKSNQFMKDLGTTVSQEEDESKKDQDVYEHSESDNDQHGASDHDSSDNSSDNSAIDELVSNMIASKQPELGDEDDDLDLNDHLLLESCSSDEHGDRDSM
jgi:hypothetical protein